MWRLRSVVCVHGMSMACVHVAQLWSCARYISVWSACTL